MSFCATAWNETRELQEAMSALPFNVELAAGTLGREQFQFYLAQDSAYLEGFARALATAAARATDSDDMAFFAGAAKDAIVTERALHAGYFRQFGLAAADVAAVGVSPTCLAYTSYLASVAQSGSYGELLAAVLPCFWVYHHVGTIISETAAADNPYRAWIDTYADEEFGAAVAQCRDAVDKAARRDEQGMLAAFTKASEYEWLFWDSAYRCEQWPTAHLLTATPR